MTTANGHGKDEMVPMSMVKTSNDNPPPYETSMGSVTQRPPPQPASSAHRLLKHFSFVPRRTKLPGVPPTNFLVVKLKSGSIKGTYAINAGLEVPDEVPCIAAASAAASSDAVKNPLMPTEPRKNLILETGLGCISAEIWLADDVVVQDRGRIELGLKARGGNIAAKIVSKGSIAKSIVAYGVLDGGSVSIALPPDFIGPVTLKATHSRISLSRTMEKRMVTFSEVNGERRCFVGDHTSAKYTGRQTWNGSIIDVASHNRGRVKLSFVDEKGAGSGILTRPFRR